MFSLFVTCKQQNYSQAKRRWWRPCNEFKIIAFFQSGMHMRGLEIRHVYVHHLLCSAMVTARYLQLLKVLSLTAKVMMLCTISSSL